MRYTGPAKPIRTQTHMFKPAELVWRVALLVFLITVLLMDLLVWRP